MQDQDQAWKSRTMILGGVLGSLVGVGAALLYVRAEEEAMEQEYEKGPQHKSVSPVAFLPIAIGLLGVIREITHLADRD